MPTTAPPAPLDITLALEGGGALGAFTWGVLDRLLDDEALRITAVSGTSAGAMNAAMLVQGLVQGGREGARALLETFWHRVAISAGSLPGPAGKWLQDMSTGMAPMFDAMRRASSMMTEGLTFDVNPLRGILSDLLRPASFAPPAPGLVVAATRVRTGEARLFRGEQVTVDALLASACLPMVFRAVEIDGEAYWDGGYSSNPPVRPMIDTGAADDLIIVRTLPTARDAAPSGASAVKNRLSEITFGSPLRAELHGLALARASLRTMGELPSPMRQLRDTRLHLIEPTAGHSGALAAMSPSWPFLAAQRAEGRQAATLWLERNRDALGRHSTLDLAPYADSEAAPVSQQPAIRHFLEGNAHAS